MDTEFSVENLRRRNHDNVLMTIASVLRAVHKLYFDHANEVKCFFILSYLIVNITDQLTLHLSFFMCIPLQLHIPM